MRFFASEIVADARDIELEIHTDEDARRRYLVAWFNEHVDAGGLGDDVDPLPVRATAEMASMMIEETMGRPVILSEVFV